MKENIFDVVQVPLDYRDFGAPADAVERFRDDVNRCVVFVRQSGERVAIYDDKVMTANVPHRFVSRARADITRVMGWDVCHGERP